MIQSKTNFFTVLALVLATSLAAAQSRAQTLELETFTVADPAIDTIYAAFGSHNQRMVWTPAGLFLVYQVTDSSDPTAIHWKLVRSRDNGASFSPVMSGSGRYPYPVIDADEHGNVYLVYSNADASSSNAYFVKLTPESGYVHNPSTDRVLAGGGAQKSVLLYDPGRHRLYYVANNNFVMNFFALDLSGNEIYPHYRITTAPAGVANPGDRNAHYPLLSLDRGDLYFGWTTLGLVTNNSSYYSAHFMASSGGGAASSWRKPNGQPIAIPVVADPTGQSIQLSAPADTDKCTWMQSLLARDGKVHASYSMCNPARVSYARYNVATSAVDLRLNPWGAEVGKYVYGLHGAFASHRDPQVATIYSVQKVGGGNSVTVLTSDDKGSTWTKRAAFMLSSGEDVYGMGGPRLVTPDGYVTGVYAKYASTPIELKLYRAKVASPLFAAPASWSNANNYNGWAKGIGDVTGDGRTDIFLRANDASSWRIWTAAGSDAGTFGTPVSWSRAGNFNGWSAETGDFNGDGKMDHMLYAVDAGGFRTWVAHATSGGNYAVPVSWSDPVSFDGWKFAAGDFTGDRKTDVMAWAVDASSWRSWVMPSLGNGGFGVRVQYYVPGDYSSFPGRELADFTGDGRTDQLLWKVDATGIHIRLARSTGTGTFSAPFAWSDTTMHLGGWQIVAADLNGDAKTDLLLYAADANSVRAWPLLSQGDGTFYFGPNYFLAGDYSGLTAKVADFNGDGFADLGLLAADASAWRIWVATGTGTGAFRTMLPWSSPWHFGGWTPYIARLNADAKADLLLIANDAGGWRTYSSLSTAP